MRRLAKVILAALLLGVMLTYVGNAAAQQEPGYGRIVEEPSLPKLFPQSPDTSQETKGLLDKSDLEEPAPSAVPGQLIVKYRPSTSSTQKANIRRQERLKKVEELGLIKAEVLQVEGRSVQAAVRDLERRPDVEYAQPDHIYELDGYGDEPLFGHLWGLNNTGQAVNNHPSGTSNVDIDALEASATTQGDSGVIVAVLDDGVDFSHPDLASRKWVNSGEVGGGNETNGMDDDGNGYIDDVNGWNFTNENNRVHTPSAFSDHGTHVAGTIAASLNNEGIVGVAPNVKIMALKIGNGSGVFESSAIQAIAYAKAKGAKIMNASWGHVGPNDVDAALKEAIEASGGLWIASAGNGGTDSVGDDNDVSPAYPASYDSPNVLSVAAVNNNGQLAAFSNYGATSVDISAPGVDILSTVPAITDDAISGVSLSNVGSSGKALVSGFGAEEISNSAAARASFFGKAFSTVDRGTQQVLLVDDDLSDIGAPDAGASISAAIQSATGAAPGEIDVPFGSDGPSLAQMQGKTVVWATGDAYYSEAQSDGTTTTVTKLTLTSTDQTNLTNFLNGGGKLIITGKDALFGLQRDHFTSDFAAKTLKLEILQDQGATAFTGKSGTAFAGESYNIGANPDRHDVVVPASFNTITQGTYNDYTSVLRPAAWSFKDGTSMAAPHVTGVAALVASARPSLLSDPVALKQAIMDSGKPAPATAGKTVTGAIVDADGAIVETPAKAIRSGFSSNALPANDDGSSGAVPLGFPINFFGTNYNSLYVNNNGNLTFDSALPDFTPGSLVSTGHIMIAPFWADVDTRAGNTTQYGQGSVDGHAAFGITWNGVGYYNSHHDKLNNFQVVLINRSDSGQGNFDIEFNYDKIQWETGDLSGGVNGLGGSSARVGYSNGSGNPGTFFELPGSAVNGALLDSNTQTGLIHKSRDISQLGRYLFKVRNGTVNVETCPFANPNIVGTQGADTLRGTARADLICGLGGSDHINGRGGNDSLSGGSGRDILDGRGDGKRDRLHGGDGFDVCYGDRKDIMSGCERKIR